MSKYPTIEAASKAAINLGIKSQAEYTNRYQEDSRLHSTPHRFYRDDWQAYGTWYGFLGKDIPDYYPTIEAASKAAINLGIKSQAEYKNRYQEDSRLHSTPHRFYRDDWQAFGTWYGFLGHDIPDYYPTIEAASKAAINLDIKSQVEYKNRYQEDPRLHSNPHRFYRDDWQAFGTWYGFLGNDIPDYYPTIEAASKAAINLGIKLQAEYKNRYQEDARLNSNPHRFYRDDWQAFGTWYGFLGNDIPDYYPTIEAASKATINLGVKSQAQYKKRYQEDPRLHSAPHSFYRDDWQAFGTWYGFLGNDIPDYYPTIEAASKAAINLGIKSQVQYNNRYQEDPRLHSTPHSFYRDGWQALGTWYGFLGKDIPDYYPTIEAASKAAINLDIKSQVEYKNRYQEDSRLHSNPHSFYRDDWQALGTWYGFLGNDIPDYYPTIEAASKAAINLGIKSKNEYKKRYQEDPRLHSAPHSFYRDDWQALGTWYGFLGNDIPDYYPTIEAASKAAINLGIKSKDEYKKRYQEDPRLHSAPHSFYRDDWQAFDTWYGFLGNDIPDFYPTIEAASKAAINLGIKSQAEYKSRYQEDPRLNSNPHRFYRDGWQALGTWYGFLGNGIPDYYPTIEAASKAAINLGIKSQTEYNNRYQEDLRLHSVPHSFYRDDWQAFGTWYGFLGKDIPDFYPTIEAASKAAINLDIKSQAEYKSRYQEDPRLHSTPRVFYCDDWQTYGTWYGFLEQSKPYSRADISLEFEGWKNVFDSFMEHSQRGLSAKKRVCVAFICKLIIENNNPSKPEVFLLRTTRVNKNHYEEFLNYFGDKDKAKFHVIVIEFLNYCLEQLCSLEDDDEVIIHPDFHNPLSRFQSPLLEIKANKLSESDKPLLAYTYVVKAKEWILPPESTNLSDLNHLQDLVPGDWFDVDPSLIDKNDPDCVYRFVEKDRREGKHTSGLIGTYNQNVCQIWCPSRFLALYALLSVPARGQQILWSDSGEADKKIPEIVNGEVQWVKNIGPLAGQAKKQGFIKEYLSNELGLHFTTNKTSRHEGGYDIPWVPDNFDYWMIKLRNWQSKYNAIVKPTKWTELDLRVPIGNRILEKRGANCFLFRMGNSEQPHQQPIFSRVLAYVLHQIEDKDNPLTTVVNDKVNLSSYKSDYTPHSMRVSLITAFVVDAKVPIHIVQKLVGHARLVMTIYYTKVGNAEIRDELSAAHKRALANAPSRIQQQIRNKQFEAVRASLVPNDRLAFNQLNDGHPASAFSFTDIGICPMGGGKCEQGGEVENSDAKHKKYLPVASGHLGEKNCIRCRFFITSPAFLGGLTAVFNEISLKQFYIKQKEQSLIIHIESLEDERYDAEKIERVFTKSMELDKAASNLEMIAKETSMYATDTVHIARLIMQCTNLLNESIEEEGYTRTMLVANTESSSINWSIDETNSEFHQLSTVCENATIYTLSDASLANARRSQLIDKMAHQNGIQPWLCMLSPEQQLEVGNQMSELLMSRLKSWENVEKLMRAEINLSDFNDDNQLIPLHDEVKKIILGSQASQLNINKTLLETV